MEASNSCSARITEDGFRRGQHCALADLGSLIDTAVSAHQNIVFRPAKAL